MYENASWKCSLLQKYSGVVSIDDGDLLHGDGRGSSGAGGARSSDDLGGFLGHLGLSGDGSSTGNSGTERSQSSGSGSASCVGLAFGVGSASGTDGTEVYHASGVGSFGVVSTSGSPH